RTLRRYPWLLNGPRRDAVPHRARGARCRACRGGKPGAAERELIMDRTLSALYDHRDDALSAMDDLVALGIPREEISMVSGSEPGETTTPGGLYGTEGEEPGFWQSLANLFTSEDDRRLHEEGISRGGATVIANVDEALADRAVDIMERHHAVDLDERARGFRTQG